jgi:hypothetical protein
MYIIKWERRPAAIALSFAEERQICFQGKLKPSELFWRSYFYPLEIEPELNLSGSLIHVEILNLSYIPTGLDENIKDDNKGSTLYMVLSPRMLQLKPHLSRTSFELY